MLLMTHRDPHYSLVFFFLFMAIVHYLSLKRV